MAKGKRAQPVSDGHATASASRPQNGRTCVHISTDSIRRQLPAGAQVMATAMQHAPSPALTLTGGPRIDEHGFNHVGHKDGILVQDFQMLVPKGGLAQLTKSPQVQNGHLQLGELHLWPDSEPISVQLKIANLHRVLPVPVTISGLPRSLTVDAAGPFLAAAYSTDTRIWTPADFLKLSPTLMAGSWSAEVGMGISGLPHRMPYEYGSLGEPDHCYGTLDVSPGLPSPSMAPTFIMPCRPPSSSPPP